MDACDAIIRRGSYGRDDDFFGWEVDHIVPKSLLEDNGVPQELIDDFRNLRPLNWRNNVSKGNDYPEYKAEICSEDGGESNVLRISPVCAGNPARIIKQMNKKWKSIILIIYIEKKCGIELCLI